MPGFWTDSICRAALALLWALAVIYPAPANAESLRRHLKDEYQNKNWFIANFYGADHLRYDSQGQILGGLAPGLWMTDGYVEVTGLDISEGHLRITAQRLLLHDDDGNGLLFQRTKRKLVIEADFDPQHKTPGDLDEVWAKIFIMRAALRGFGAGLLEGVRFRRLDRLRRGNVQSLPVCARLHWARD